MKIHNIFLIFSLFGIVAAFFMGYFFAQRQFIMSAANNTLPKYVDIRTSTRNITITEVPENIFIRVNGEVFSTGSIELKE